MSSRNPHKGQGEITLGEDGCTTDSLQETTQEYYKTMRIRDIIVFELEYNGLHRGHV